ncbi:MAG: sulfate adenylyltransferase subunit CysD, partial [Pseudomonadota bacterium]
MDTPELIQNNPDSAPYWDTNSTHEAITQSGSDQTLRSTERLLEKTSWLPPILSLSDVMDEKGRPLIQLVVDSLTSQAKKKRAQSLIFQCNALEKGGYVVIVNDGRGGRRWRFEDTVDATTLPQILDQLVDGKPAYIWPHGDVTDTFRLLHDQAKTHDLKLPSGTKVVLALTAYRSNLTLAAYPDAPPKLDDQLTHLDRLEAESIHIMREVVAQAENPVMLYSVGKDSSVMLHLARKAFYPSPPPFPLMHVDTRWKFQMMYEFRDQMAEEVGMDLICHINPEAIEKNINPFDHGSALHTDVTKTQGLKQALDKHGFDVAFGGARRDEEKSRAKERVFSFRTSTHRWDPKNQRPELWNLYNGHKSPGE